MNEVNGHKQLIRPQKGRMVAGVCAGLGDYFGMDPNVIRLVFAVLSIFGFAGVAAYLVAWLVIPEEGHTSSVADNLIHKNRSG